MCNKAMGVKKNYWRHLKISKKPCYSYKKSIGIYHITQEDAVCLSWIVWND